MRKRSARTLSSTLEWKQEYVTTRGCDSTRRSKTCDDHAEDQAFPVYWSACMDWSVNWNHLHAANRGSRTTSHVREPPETAIATSRVREPIAAAGAASYVHESLTAARTVGFGFQKTAAPSHHATCGRETVKIVRRHSLFRLHARMIKQKKNKKKPPCYHNPLTETKAKKSPARGQPIISMERRGKLFTPLAILGR
jgi:hypothetical protein